MPEHFEQPNPFDAWSDAERLRLSNDLRRGYEVIKRAVLSGRTAHLAPRFRAFFAFCRDRQLSPEAQDFVDAMKRMAASFKIGA